MSVMTHRRASELFLAFSVFGLSACLPGGAVDTNGGRALTERCRPPSGVSGNPTNIYEATTLMNALPKPTSVACFVEALDRPLKIQATSSQASAQPAHGERSPRIFIFKGSLSISVVPAANGADTAVEFGETRTASESVKGSVPFPLLDVIPTSAPFTNILFGGGTGCVFCHTSEFAVPDNSTHTDAFVSKLILPDPVLEVSVSKVIGYTRACDSTKEPDRCAVLRAIVGENEDVSRGSFY